MHENSIGACGHRVSTMLEAILNNFTDYILSISTILVKQLINNPNLSACFMLVPICLTGGWAVHIGKEPKKTNGNPL